MASLLLRHADRVVTMDDQRREIVDGAVLIEQNVVRAVGPTAELPAVADEVIDCRGMVVLPGLINTHHHLFQTLTRALPPVQEANLFTWLTRQYPIWSRVRGDDIYVSAQLGLAELLLSGCTTAADHLYLFPNDVTIDDEIRAAQELGIRFHASRGSMTLGESQGGLPPDSLVEDDAAVLRDTRRAIEAYHDPAPYAMTRIVVAPCAPFNVTPELMRESRVLAQSYNVSCHTHLAETLDEEHYCVERFGVRPLQYVEELGWAGGQIWYAHGVHFNTDEIARMATDGVGVAHCPSSNMRLASGIAPIGAMLGAGVPVGLGVDGSASNDSGHLLAEARMCMLLQRVGGNPAALTARQALELATRGGAQVLGRDDIGSLAPGKAADVACWRVERVAYAGALHDPVAAIVFCQPQNADLVIVNGRVRVRDQIIVGIDTAALVAEHNRRALALVQG